MGLALDIPFELIVDDADPGDGFLRAEQGHPAALAYVSAGGTAETLWWRSPIPPGRGLGFSGAAVVAGAFAASGDADEAFRVGAAIETHPDNAAPSAYGGCCVVAGGRTVRVPMPISMELALWWPDATTSTRRARATLPSTVPFSDAVHNVGHVALLIAALATGDLEAVATAIDDRLHTDARLALSPASSDVLTWLNGHPEVVAGWLSGSGPTVAAFIRPAGEATSNLDSVVDGLARFGGTARMCRIADRGVHVVGSSGGDSRARFL